MTIKGSLQTALRPRRIRKIGSSEIKLNISRTSKSQKVLLVLGARIRNLPSRPTKTKRDTRRDEKDQHVQKSRQIHPALLRRNVLSLMSCHVSIKEGFLMSVGSLCISYKF